ncbi:GNAT family N-acetyltransferase [Metabacillus indicus]|uniref:GNAT family N-acetyltransferase n=1 Tax=Metabacillus indicus TaxID=246786 RepID=UPI000493545A|nr:GNAT family N-acetyltransferase [Metabacillus indicus]KEZ52746.1 hypothetical protein AZ46_0203115 [Metabacillus indicus LMG 22858]
MEITIRKLIGGEAAPMHLLLEADPEEKAIQKYLHKSIVFLAEHQEQTAGVLVLNENSSTSLEVMNLAVDEAFRGKGIAKKLLARARMEGETGGYDFLEISTGNSSLDQLALYQKCGFRMDGIISNYFLDHYDKPIYENGIPCLDMVRLKMSLT